MIDLLLHYINLGDNLPRKAQEDEGNRTSDNGRSNHNNDDNDMPGRTTSLDFDYAYIRNNPVFVKLITKGDTCHLKVNPSI